MPDKTPPGKKYPSFYEKAVPITLVIVVIAIVILLIIIIAVFFDVLPGAR